MKIIQHDSIGGYLRLLRQEKGLSQIDLSRKLGCHKQYVNNWEMGKCSPSMDLFCQVMIVLKVPGKRFSEDLEKMQTNELLQSWRRRRNA